MARTLSQEEIDGLVEAINAQEAATASAERRLPRKIMFYDFRRPDKFSKEQILTMQDIHEAFSRLSITTLSAAMRAIVHVHVASVDQLNYEEFIRSIPSPTTIAVVDMDPLKGHAIMEIDPSISFAIIERLFGGLGDGGLPGINRELTDIERSIMEGIIVRLLGNFREAWSRVLDLRPRLTQIETNPLFAQIVPPSEMVILVSLETRIGGVEGMINLCFPFITIEPIIAKLSAQYWYSSLRHGGTAETVKALLGHIEGMDVAVELMAEGARISLRDLGALKKGSLLRVPGLDRGEASFRMGGKNLFRMKECPRKWGEAQVYDIVEKPAEEALPVLEPEDMENEGSRLEAAFRKALADFQSGIGANLSGIATGIKALLEKQVEMTDQLALTPSDAALPEAARGNEHGRPFAFIRGADPAHVLNFLSQEHPQTIALILSYLEPQTASSLLGSLAADLQPEVAKRIARIGRTMPEVVWEVERVLEKKLSIISSEAYAEAGGIDGIVQILNMSDRSTERQVVESLERNNPDLAEEIKKRMFVFEDIVLLERSAVGKLAKRIDSELLLRAMKASPEDVRVFIWECLPQDEAKALKSRLEGLGKLRLSEVEAAQQKIVAMLREMEESGEIVIARPGETVE
jgi:flagellar motor switch protein FliM